MKKLLLAIAKIFKIDLKEIKIVEKIVEKQVINTDYIDGDVYVNGNLTIIGELKVDGDITCYNKIN